MKKYIYGQTLAEARNLRKQVVNCRRCHGRGVIFIKRGRTYETDSDDEIAAAYDSEECPECLTALVIYGLRSALAEANDEVCICGHHKSTHGEFADPLREDYPCTYCDCKRFLSRRAAIAEETRKAEGK